MKKTRKLLIVFALCLAMTLIFTAAALADPSVNTSDNSVTVTKGIMLLNDDGGTYYSPNVTYTYTVAPATGTMPTVTDGSEPPVTATVKAGPANSVSFTTSFDSCVTSKDVAFASAPETFYTSADADGAAPITENLTLNFNMGEFSAPGVYRYVLKDETTPATLNAAGIVRPSDYDDEVYLDIYVRSKTDGSGFEIYGAVLVPGDGDVTTATEKPAGLDNDEYYTFNVEITKTTVGDTSHAFPFTIAVDNPTGNPDTNLTYYVGDSTSSLSPKTAGSVSPNLKSGDTYYICGLSPQAKINVTETNDTSETYTVEAIAGSITWIDSQAVAPNGTVSIATVTQAVTDYPTDNTLPTSVTQTATLKKIDFTNTYESISPTGLVLRYGPFVLLLAGAACFFLIGRRRKETEEESDRI